MRTTTATPPCHPAPPHSGRTVSRAIRLRTLAMLAGGCALGLLACVGCPAPAAAAFAPGLQLGEADRADLQRIEDALNKVRTLRSAFVQNSSNGESAEGELSLSRPGRLRVDYKPPSPVLVVADGQFLVYYDRHLEQVSYIPLGSTPASILLEERISLSDRQLTITGFERADGFFRMDIVRTNNSGEGSITLIFDQSSLALSQWAVTDAQGIVTVVSLINPQFNVKVDNALFTFVDPRPPARHSP